MDIRILKRILILVFPLLLIGCKNNEFPESTKPEMDYITVFGNGEPVSLKLNKTGLQAVTIEQITPDEDAVVKYYDKEGNIVSPADFSNVASIRLSNHRLNFSLLIGDNSMSFVASESTYYESYYIRILFKYTYVVEQIEVRIEPGHPMLLYSISYDFDKSQVIELTEYKVKETITNNTDAETSSVYRPYAGVGGNALLKPDVNWLSDLEYDIPIPKYVNEEWSHKETQKVHMYFGRETKFTTQNIDNNITVPVTIPPNSTLTIVCSLTYSRLTVPFDAVLYKQNTGIKEYADGTAVITVPISFNVSIEQPEL